MSEQLSSTQCYGDVVFCIDSTFSMASKIEEVKQHARKIPAMIRDALAARGLAIDLRMRVIDFQDIVKEGEDTGIHEAPFTDDETAFQTQVDRLQALEGEGGGDLPESSLDALLRALDSNWQQNRDGQVRKIIVLMTDAPPQAIHESSLKDGEEKDVSTVVARLMRESGLRVVLLVPPGVPEYKALAGLPFCIYIPCDPGKGLAEIDLSAEVIPCISASFE